MTNSPQTNWPEVAEQVASILPLSSLEPSACALINRFKNQETLLIACSGGADSVSLVLLIYGHFPQLRAQLRIIHFNHHLRGDDANDDAAFVSDLARTLKLPYELGEEQNKSTKAPSEAILRDQRLAFFSQTAKRTQAAAILLGQQQDDIAETMLMRIARGSGTSGLSAPRPVQYIKNEPPRLRPLLTLSRNQIRAALTQCQAPWREDASNLQSYYFRNRIRAEVLPALDKASQHKVIDCAARSRRMLEEDDTALNAISADALQQVKKDKDILDADSLSALPRAIVRRVLHLWLDLIGKAQASSGDAFEILLDTVCQQKSGTHSLAGGTIVELKQAHLFIRPTQTVDNWPEQKLMPGQCLSLPSGNTIKAQWQTLNESDRQAIISGQVDQNYNCHLAYDTTEDITLTIRQWQNGDRYRPLGCPGSRKLQDIFSDKKIAESTRHSLPVICNDNGDVIWSPGLPPPEIQKITGKTNQALMLTYSLV